MLKGLKTVDWISILSFVASGGLATTAQALSGLYPTQQTKIIGYAAVAAGVAGCVLRIVSVKAGAPATAVVKDAPIVPDGTTVVHQDTPVLATNISSTSTLLK